MGISRLISDAERFLNWSDTLLQKNISTKKVLVAIFQQILERHNLTKHDGRPIWQYQITPEEYNALKESISHNLARGKHSVCARDAVAFAAEWWKTEYTGGPVSWKNIVEAFGRSGNDFQTARK